LAGWRRDVERVAVVNIAIEGMLLAGAFTGALMGSVLGGWGGLAVAVVHRRLFGFILAALVVTYRMDQIIAGVVINLFVLGLTSYVSSQVFAEMPHLNNAPVFRSWKIPMLGDIPVIGPMLFNQNIFVYGALVMVASRPTTCSTPGRACAPARSANIRAPPTRWASMSTGRATSCDDGGMVAGLRRGLVHARLGRKVRREHDRRARLHRAGGDDLRALAPRRRAVAALVFGFTDSLQQKLALLHTPIPSEFLAMAPYIATIVVVAGLVGKARPPAADGKPYVKE
jgi:ABC-type uncharacterized transport system permease subunit